MKIKCANCNQKTIPLILATTNYIFKCPNCNKDLIHDLDSKKFNIVTIIMLIILILIGLYFKNNNFQLWIAASLCFTGILMSGIFLSITKIKTEQYIAPSLSIKHGFIVTTLLISYVFLVLLVNNLKVQFILGIVGWFLLAYVIYVFKKASKSQK
jgi:phosphatidylglycerophosphate synthase